MQETRERQWFENYEKLKEYILEHHHLPDKHRVENRGLLNWWKYNMKRIKQGSIPQEKIEQLNILAEMRSKEHTGGRKKTVKTITVR